jgi:hypothetical protein
VTTGQDGSQAEEFDALAIVAPRAAAFASLLIASS